MPRPRKCRYVEYEPEKLYFKPRGIPLVDLEEIDLKVEELEAVRLKHKEELSQKEAAGRMKVSRSTFARILKEAQEKVADFLIGGNALKVEGGEYAVNVRTFRCENCDNEWGQPYGKGRPKKCPECGSNDIISKHEIKRPEKGSKSD